MRFLFLFFTIFQLSIVAGFAKATADRSRVLLVRPIILCDDDGTNPARHALPKKLADQVYTRADLEFLYLDPIPWNHGKARRGEINLNTIVSSGIKNGMITTDPRVATLLFVSGVDGQTQPLGRGLQGGNICFVNLGTPDKMKNPAERAFVVAHEQGHCLSLIHAVDDPKVPNDVPNLQGDGPYEERLAVEGLHPTQVETVIKSPLALLRLQFLNTKETAEAIANDQWDNPLEPLTADNFRFELGLEVDAPLPEDQAARVAIAREKYAALARDFSEDEIETLTTLVNKLDGLVRDRWPMIQRVPWQFAKMDSTFCRAMPHTRGLTIVLTESCFQRFSGDESLALEILLHEKLHVLQRLMPKRFATSFARYGYQSVKLPPDTAKRFNFVRNPDAPDARWSIRLETGLNLLATSLETEEGQLKFVEHSYLLQPAGENETDHSHTVGDPQEPGEEMIKWRQQFPIKVGHDDPREVMAYLLGKIFRADLLEEADEELTPSQVQLLKDERPHLRKILSSRADRARKIR